MNFTNLNESFENKYKVSKRTLREHKATKKAAANRKAKLLESAKKTLTERYWRLTVPGSYRAAIFTAADEDDMEQVKDSIIAICDYVIDNAAKTRLKEDELEDFIAEWEDLKEELEYQDFEDEEEADYWLGEMYDLMDNSDVFLGLEESLKEDTILNPGGRYQPKYEKEIEQRLRGFLFNKGYDTDSEEVKNYITAAAELIGYSPDEYSVEEWYKDTLENYPEDLAALPKVRESLGEAVDLSQYSDGYVEIRDGEPTFVYDTLSAAKDGMYWSMRGDAEYEGPVHKYEIKQLRNGQLVDIDESLNEESAYFGWSKEPIEKLINLVEKDKWLLTTDTFNSKIRYYLQDPKSTFNTFEIEKSTYDKLKKYADKDQIINESSEEATPEKVTKSDYESALWVMKHAFKEKDLKAAQHTIRRYKDQQKKKKTLGEDMYRQYEDPYALEDRYNELASYYRMHPEEHDDYAEETLAELRDRINFAWQDDEYDSDYYRDEFYSDLYNDPFYDPEDDRTYPDPDPEDDIQLTTDDYNAGQWLESLDEINLSEYESSGSVDGYATYRKVIKDKSGNPRGIWAAQDYEQKYPPFSITYDQARGYEPIVTDHDSTAKILSRELGKKLLPPRGYNESYKRKKKNLKGKLDESWSGVFSVRKLMQEFGIDKNSAKKLSDYLYDNSYDDGFKHQDDALDFYRDEIETKILPKITVDESLKEGFYPDMVDDDFEYDMHLDEIEFERIRPEKYEIYDWNDLKRALKKAKEHGYRDSWIEGRSTLYIAGKEPLREEVPGGRYWEPGWEDANDDEEDLAETYRQTIIDWMYDHPQALRDIQSQMGVRVEDVSLNGLKAWIAQHKQLKADFENYFHDELDESCGRKKKLDELVAGRKLTGGSMGQDDRAVIQPIIDAIAAFEEGHEGEFYITWNFGRRASDNKMTAGVDINFSGPVREDEKQKEAYVNGLLDVINQNGYIMDPALGYDKSGPREGIFGGFHYQIVEAGEDPDFFKEALEDEVEDEEDDDDDFKLDAIEQEFTSKNTSVNNNKLPAIFARIDFKPGTINLDYGGGKFDNATEKLAERDVVNLIYDKYNRTPEWNRKVIKQVRANGGADTATCCNVLNVIKEPEERLNVIRNISRLLKTGGTAYFYFYKGDNNGVGRQTGKDSYQLNRKNEEYLDEIKQVFPNAKPKGGMIVATNGGSANESLRESKGPSKIVGKSWQEFISNIEAQTDYNVDSAYKGQPEQWIELVDKETGKIYDGEVTKYSDGSYELMSYNITPSYYQESLNDDFEFDDEDLDEAWDVNFYNELDADFGHDPGPGKRKTGLDKATAKSIARALNKRTPNFVSYWADEDDETKVAESLDYSNPMEDFEKYVAYYYYPGFDYGGLSDDEYYELEDTYNREIDRYNQSGEERPWANASLTEDTIKQNGKWVNKGKEGNHGKFKTKKQADAQRKAMFANRYKAEALDEGVPGGRYWEPGWEDANDDLDDTVDNYDGEELPFESLKEEYYWPNGMPVSDLDIEKALDFMYGEDRNMDRDAYSDKEIEKAINYLADRT